MVHFDEIWEVLLEITLHFFHFVNKCRILLKTLLIFVHEYSFLQRW